MKNLFLKLKMKPRLLVLVIVSIFHQQFKSQNNALDFDGFNDNVVINHSPSLDFSINSSFSIEAWFKTTSFASDCIFSKMDNNSPYTGYELYSEGGSISFLLINAWTSNCIWVHTVNSFNNGLWHHVALVYKGIPNANNVDIFVDGILQAKTITYNSLSGSTNTNNNAGIGARSNNGYFFSGSIDEVRVWNRALCSFEIINNKNCHLNGNESGLVAYYNFNQGIANGNNFSTGLLVDQTINNNTGILTSFALNGFNSNWVSSSANILGTCTPIIGSALTVSGSSLVCAGANATLNVSGATNYTWFPGALVGAQVVTSPVGSTIYTVVATSTSGCNTGLTATLSTIVHALPQIQILLSSNSICQGNSFTPNATGATTYSWSGGLSNGVPFTPSASGNYTVVGVDLNGCSNTATTVVTVNPLPTLSISTNSLVSCPGQSVTLTAMGATSYLWASGQTSSVITVSPLSSTGYALIGTNTFGCNNTTSITQSVSACVGLDTYSLESQVPVLVYPNPNAGDFYFKSSDDRELKLVNDLGQLICTIKLDKSNNYEFNVNNLSSGIYYVLLTSETYNGSLKIVCFQ